MIDTKRKEELSKSYLNAICAFRGIAVESQVHDDDSIDVIIKKCVRKKDGTLFQSMIGVQLKATSQILGEDDKFIKYPLEIKNYNDLRTASTTPKILCVLLLHCDELQWISQSVDELIIRNCMYWIDLSNLPDVSNNTSVTLSLPKNNIVSSDAINDLLIQIAEEGEI